MTLTEELRYHAKTLDRLNREGYSSDAEEQLAELQERVDAIIDCLSLVLDLAEDTATTRDGEIRKP